jgi:hypothetical protein
MAKVTITLETTDEVLDTACANMPDEILLLAIDAMAVSTGWTETVPNPDFKPAKAEGVDNPRTLPNVSKARNFSYQLRKYAENQTTQYVRQQAQVTAQKTADDAAKALLGQVVVE